VHTRALPRTGQNHGIGLHGNALAVRVLRPLPQSHPEQRLPQREPRPAVPGIQSHDPLQTPCRGRHVTLCPPLCRLLETVLWLTTSIVFKHVCGLPQQPLKQELLRLHQGTECPYP